MQEFNAYEFAYAGEALQHVGLVPLVRIPALQVRHVGVVGAGGVGGKACAKGG